jgi:hypothetical protein
LCFKNDALQALNFGGESSFTRGGDAIEAAVVVLGTTGARGVDDELLVHELLEVVVEGAGADSVGSIGLARDLLDEAVAVQVFAGESEKDVEGGCREGRRGF